LFQRNDLCRYYPLPHFPSHCRPVTQLSAWPPYCRSQPSSPLPPSRGSFSLTTRLADVASVRATADAFRSATAERLALYQPATTFDRTHGGRLDLRPLARCITLPVHRLTRDQRACGEQSGHASNRCMLHTSSQSSSEEAALQRAMYLSRYPILVAQSACTRKYSGRADVWEVKFLLI
jgi:hypothetical protein